MLVPDIYYRAGAWEPFDVDTRPTARPTTRPREARHWAALERLYRARLPGTPS